MKFAVKTKLCTVLKNNNFVDCRNGNCGHWLQSFHRGFLTRVLLRTVLVVLGARSRPTLDFCAFAAAICRVTRRVLGVPLESCCFSDFSLSMLLLHGVINAVPKSNAVVLLLQISLSMPMRAASREEDRDGLRTSHARRCSGVKMDGASHSDVDE